MRSYEEPVVTPHPSPGSPDATRETHPSYATIGASRVSGTTSLFQSDFKHHNYMTIRIYRADVDRHLNHDWVHPESLRPLVEVKLSEAQWATFVSTPNSGFGTPCTLDYFDGQEVPQIPEPKDRTDQFNAELKKDTEKARAELAKLKEMLTDMRLPQKTKEGLLKQLWMCERSIDSSIPFVAKSFSEHVEKTKERAKIEIHAHAMNYINRLGMEALANQLPIQLDAPPVEKFLEGEVAKED